MDTLSKRREFLKIAGLSVPVLLLNQTVKGSNSEGKSPLTLGIASYSFRNYSLDETIAMTKTLGIQQIALKSMHLPLEDDEAAIRSVRKKIEDAGITLYGAGVVYMNTEDEVNNAFRYAKAAGMEVIIGVPAHNLLDLVEKNIQTTGIKVAIHNHGPGDDQYPSPESIYEKVKNRDERLGICMDIGHTQRIGLDPAREAKKYFDRLHDVHIKDVTHSTAEGESIEIGRGVIDIPAFIKVLLTSNYKGIVSFEFEKDPDNIMPGISESVGYVRGVTDTLKK